jgi:tight adherence protein B
MVSLVLLGAAVLCWPTRRSRTRLRDLSTTGRPARRWRPPRPGPLGVVAGVGVLAWLAVGPGAGVAAAVLSAVLWRRWQSRRRLRAGLDAISALAEAVRSLATGLRTGAHPAEAADLAAADAAPPAADVLRAIAAAARLDGDIHRALATVPTLVLTDALSRLGRAWVLATRHGLPLADVLDAVARDLDQRARFSRQVLARMAGPRASATILALLPAVGVALGEAMGARPLHVLTTTAAGQLLLVTGVALLCAGIAWSARLTERVVLR